MTHTHTNILWSSWSSGIVKTTTTTEMIFKWAKIYQFQIQPKKKTNWNENGKFSNKMSICISWFQITKCVEDDNHNTEKKRKKNEKQISNLILIWFQWNNRCWSSRWLSIWLQIYSFFLGKQFFLFCNSKWKWICLRRNKNFDHEQQKKYCD